MRTIITIILLVAVLVSGCIEMPEQIQPIVPIQPKATSSIISPEPTPTPLPPPEPTIAIAIQKSQPEPALIPSPKINPDKIRLKLSYSDGPPENNIGYLSLIIFNEGETDLTNLIIYFVQSGGKEPDSWSQIFYSIPAGKSVWEKTMIHKHPAYWTDMSYYIELDRKMVELTNYETSWVKD